jgi:predicted AAA+ superfamily ATPase
MRSIIDSIYPEKERKLFTDREIELALLDNNTERILDGSGENICFIGLRRVGKSLTLKQYISKLDSDRVFAVYMALNVLTLPRNFSRFNMQVKSCAGLWMMRISPLILILPLL